MSAKYLFAADMGASGGKCFVGKFEDGGFEMQEVHRFAHEGVSYYVPDGTGAVSERIVWDDTFIYRNILEGIRCCKREVSDTVHGIGIDTWGADGQLMSADGDVISKTYCYRDHRLDDMIDKVKARIDASRVYGITGVHFQPFNVSNQLLWQVLNRPALPEGAFYLPIPSLFYYYLGGCRVVDSSWASVTQLMDAATREWSDEILSALGIPKSIMPPIVPPGQVVGTLQEGLAASLGINRAPLISVGSHDTASAYASAPVSDPSRSLIISSGTWALVGKLTDTPVTTAEAMAANLSNEGGIGNVRLLKNCMGGWLVQELRRVWRHVDGKEMSWKDMDAQTEAAEPLASLIDPDDPSFYNPSNMEEAMAEFCQRTGQAVPATRGAFMRMVYESQALKYRLINDQLCSATGTQNEVVHIVGGGCRNIMLAQFTADALALPVITGPEEGSAVGNLMVQAVGAGILPNIGAAQPLIRKAFPITEYAPRSGGAWDEAYARFKTLCGVA